LLGVVGAGGVIVVQSALEARRELTSATSTISTFAGQMVSGDTEGARTSVAQLTQSSSAARQQTSGWVWRAFEILPFVGDDLAAVRTVTEVVDDLVVDVATPAAQVSVADLMPKDGAFDLA